VKRWIPGLLVFALATTPAFGQDPTPPAESLESAFPSKDDYSPYAGRNFPTRVLWGDTHLHTGMSMDAGAFGARLMPDDAHRFAKGEELTSSTGLKVKLSRPLDFLVVADHSDNMGFFPKLYAGDPAMLSDPTGRRWYDMVMSGGQDGTAAAVEIIVAFSNDEFPPALASRPGTDAYLSAWEVAIDAAEAHNEPGRYTALHGYEWTSNTAGNNLHRVVILRDDGHKASMVLPFTTLPPEGSDDPEDLWKWMEGYQDKTGGRTLAIAHNGNLSNGIMFPEVQSLRRSADRRYAETRARWEPLYEADYETWDQGNLDLSVPKQDDMLEFEYARSALGIGLRVGERTGVNPYKFGMIGATDSHTGLATAGEDNFFGKHSGSEPGPERWKHPMAKIGDLEYAGWSMVASGLAGVWAKENTREAIFDAMVRKETYATTGPRMLVRFFGGWNFEASDAQGRLPADAGYVKGVPMGADLLGDPEGRAPSFLVAALKDPLSGNLDRVQIVKVWLEGREYREKIYEVVASGDRVPGADGKLTPVGNTVDVANATWTNTIGAAELIGVWSDPDFDPKQPAAYYARVIEIPTPRWTAYEAKRYALTLPPEVPMVTQERAYTSPIWFTPAD
jgi:hypothetical protein